MSFVYPPASNTISGDNITASRFANSPPLLARAMRDLASYRYIGGLLLPQRITTTSGSINFELTGEAITADATPTQVSPGSEYQITTAGLGTVDTASVGKWGQDSIITDEAISRLQFAAINKVLTKLVNSAKILIDTAVVSAVNSAITATTSAAAKWDGSGSTPTILRDILKAVSAIRATGLGYNPDLLLVADEALPYLASDATIATAMAREDRSNPIYTGRFPVLAGLEVMAVPSANLPGGVTTSAFVLDRNQLGFILTENIGGGYLSAGDLVETKSYREEGSDGVRVRARSVFKAVVTDPLAAYKITTVL